MPIQSYMTYNVNIILDYHLCEADNVVFVVLKGVFNILSKPITYTRVAEFGLGEFNYTNHISIKF